MARRDLSWTDAWIFASLSARGGTALRDLIARADLLNHAIPTVAEIGAGLEALFREGLVTARAARITLTKAGRRVHADGLGRRGGLFSIVDNMLKALRSPRRAVPPPPARPRARSPFGFVTGPAVTRAYREYTNLAG